MNLGRKLLNITGGYMDNFIENCKSVVMQTLSFPMAAYVSSQARMQDVKLTYESLNIVWFCKTLQNHKALVMSTHDMYDHIYWEVTYNGDKDEYYVDEYKKQSNMVIQGEDIEAM